jgi:predicted metal-dependent enzyme (double-stranded beta helix superfamily)
MKSTILALLLAFAAAPLQNLPPSTPRDGAKQLIDNNRVAVWDVTLEKGKPTAMHEHRYNMVGINLTDATLKVVNRVGRVSTRISRKGELISAQKGSADSQEVTSTEPWHAIMIDLKDAVVPPLANNSGYPEAFPREGAKKLLDNARVTVWDYSWPPGTPSTMHFHSKDVVVVYLGDGDLSSTTPDGRTVVNTSTFGQVKFNARDRIHSELLVKGSQRVIAVELK